MMVYLIDKNTNEIIQTFENVQEWNEEYVVYDNSGFIGKTYCDPEAEYFTDEELQKTTVEE